MVAEMKRVMLPLQRCHLFASREGVGRKENICTCQDACSDLNILYSEILVSRTLFDIDRTNNKEIAFFKTIIDLSHFPLVHLNLSIKSRVFPRTLTNGHMVIYSRQLSWMPDFFVSMVAMSTVASQTIWQWISFCDININLSKISENKLK